MLTCKTSSKPSDTDLILSSVDSNEVAHNKIYAVCKFNYFHLKKTGQLTFPLLIIKYIGNVTNYIHAS